MTWWNLQLYKDPLGYSHCTEPTRIQQALVGRDAADWWKGWRCARATADQTDHSPMWL